MAKCSDKRKNICVRIYLISIKQNSTLNMICVVLDCQPADILEYREDD